LKQILNSLTE